MLEDRPLPSPDERPDPTPAGPEGANAGSPADSPATPEATSEATSATPAGHLVDDDAPWEWSEGIEQLMSPAAAAAARRQQFLLRALLALIVILLVGSLIASAVALRSGIEGARATPSASAVAGALVSSAPSASPDPDAATASAASASPSATPTGGESLAPASGTPEDARAPRSPAAGTLVLSNDFADANGWPQGKLSSLTELSVSPGGYVVRASGRSTDHMLEAPVAASYPRIAVTVTAAQSNSPGTAGFGVICKAGVGSGFIYEFLVLSNGGWLVEKRQGDSGGGPPTILAHGTSNSVPGARPISVSGECATAADGGSTRLVLSVEGLVLGDFADAVPAPAGGWRGGLVVSTVDVAATVVFRHFDERALD
jgi:hypothetical protein